MRESLRRKVIWAGCKLSKDNPIDVKLPWRQIRTPYRIFLAEMLLVRTRADVVARIFEDVHQRYPDIHVLANADEGELNMLLKPLGLTKRVPFFIKAARYICEKHEGKIPDNIPDLLKVPGLGMYTASAIATFAHGHTLVPADVNIFRFIARITGLEMTHKTKGSQELRHLLPFLSESYTRLHAEHLLDFTRLICRPRNPLCSQCPLTLHCLYYKEINHKM